MHKLRDWLAEALSNPNNFDNIEMQISAGNGHWSTWLMEEDPQWKCELVVQMKKWSDITPTIEDVQSWILQQASWYSHAIFGWINENYQSENKLCRILIQTYIKHFEAMLSTVPGFSIAWFEHSLTTTRFIEDKNSWKDMLSRLEVERLSTELMYASEHTLPYLRDEWLSRQKDPYWVKETAYWIMSIEVDRNTQIEYILENIHSHEYLYGIMLLKMLYPTAYQLLDSMQTFLEHDPKLLSSVWKHQLLNQDKTIAELDVIAA